MKRILVVEDNAMNMELVTYILQSNGIDVTQAVDGPEALENINQKVFDLVLLDIQLPGIDGVEILNKIKGNPSLKNMPVVALTAHAMQGDEQYFVDVGFKGYISKPIDVSAFMGKVLSFLSERRHDP